MDPSHITRLESIISFQNELNDFVGLVEENFSALTADAISKKVFSNPIPSKFQYALSKDNKKFKISFMIAEKTVDEISFSIDYISKFNKDNAKLISNYFFQMIKNNTKNYFDTSYNSFVEYRSNHPNPMTWHQLRETFSDFINDSLSVQNYKLDKPKNSLTYCLKINSNDSYAINMSHLVSTGGKSRFYLATNLNERSEDRVYGCLVRTFPDSFESSFQVFREIFKNGEMGNVISFFGHSTAGDEQFLFTEFCTGGNLLNPTRYDMKTLTGFIADLYRGMFQLKHVGFAHGDIKPENVLITLQNRRLVAKLGDLEFAHPVESTKIVLAGTLGYAAPEMLIQKDRGISLKTDLYSAAVTAFEVLCKQSIFQNYPPTQSDVMAHFKNLTHAQSSYDARFDEVTPSEEAAEDEAVNLYCDMIEFMRMGMNLDPMNRPTIEESLIFYSNLHSNGLTLFFPPTFPKDFIKEA